MFDQKYFAKTIFDFLTPAHVRTDVRSSKLKKAKKHLILDQDKKRGQLWTCLDQKQFFDIL